MAMHLTSSSIFTAWEAGVDLCPLDRAIVILWAAGMDGDIAALPLVERDRALLRLRAATFGPDLSARATCPDCGEDLEMDFEMEALAYTIPAAIEEQFQSGNALITLRALTSRDLAAVMTATPVEIPRLLRARLANTDELTEIQCTELDQRIESREEEAEISARLTCTACSATWREVLDITAILWTEIEARAHRLLSEIVEMATVLGWSERDILCLPEARRQAYLSLVRRQ